MVRDPKSDFHSKLNYTKTISLSLKYSLTLSFSLSLLLFSIFHLQIHTSALNLSLNSISYTALHVSGFLSHRYLRYISTYLPNSLSSSHNRTNRSIKKKVHSLSTLLITWSSLVKVVTVFSDCVLLQQ